MSAGTLPEIRESEASPEVAAIYRDMKEVMGLPMVNLIYRYVATLPGCLPWIWGMVRPHFLSGAMERAAAELRKGLALPALAAVGPRGLTDAGIDAQAKATIRRTIDAYNRGNSANLISLTAIRLALDRDVPMAPEGAETPAPPPDVAPLPSILRREDLEPGTAATVRALTSLHGTAGVSVIPSLYLHLAHWPAFLDLARARLEPVADDLAAASEQARALARTEAERLYPALRATRPRPAAENCEALERELGRFTGGLIPEMIAVGLMLRGAMP